MVTPHAYKWLKTIMINRKLVTITLTAMACMMYQIPLYSGVYKWTDDTGQIHYSDQPNKPNAEEFGLPMAAVEYPRSGLIFSAIGKVNSSGNKKGRGSARSAAEAL